MKKYLFTVLTILLIVSCSSLKTTTKQYEILEPIIQKNEFSKAITTLEKESADYYSEKEKVLYHLDVGMLNYYNRDFQGAIDHLSKAEKGMEELFTQSVSKGAASLLVNDNVLDYSGEDYENVYVNLFKSICYYHLGKFDEAFVEIRRMNEKIKLLKTKYQELAESYNSSKDKKVEFEIKEINFDDSALGRYLSALFYRTEGNYDEARIDLQQLKNIFTNNRSLYNFSCVNTDNILKENGKAKVNFTSFLGRGPLKRSNDYSIKTYSNQLVIYKTTDGKLKQVDMMSWPNISKGLSFKFCLPFVDNYQKGVDNVVVQINGSKQVKLQPIEEIDNIAKDSFERKKSLIYIKSITRAVTKGLLNEAANKELDKETGGGIFGTLTRALTGALVDATENADLRISRFFPAKVAVAELELEPGKYEFTFKYFDKNERLIESKTVTKEIEKNKLNLIDSFCIK